MNSKRNEPPSSEKSDTIRQNASSLISRGRVSAAINDDVRSSSTLNRLISPKLTPRTVRRLSLHMIPPPMLRPVVTTILRRQYACNYLEGQQPREENRRSQKSNCRRAYRRCELIVIRRYSPPCTTARRGGCVIKENFAKPPKLTQPGWFSFWIHRKTTPASR